MKRIYADNAATTPINFNASVALINTMYQFPGNPSSSHEEGREAKEKLEEYRSRCAACLDCEPNEIVFTSGATEGNNTVKIMTVRDDLYHYSCSTIEHPSMYNSLGADIGVKPNGIVVDFDDYGWECTESLLSIMAANNEIGTIQPIWDIADYCRSKRILFHTDATAAVGHIRVSFREIGADFLTLSAHKFHGPRGVGILIVRNGTEFDPLMTGGKQERGHRAGTENLPGIAGMTVALEESVRNLEEKMEKTVRMRDKLMEGLLSIPGTILNGDPERRLPGNVNVSFDGIEGESLLTLLDAHGISASAGSACHTGVSEPSHVLLAIGRTREQANASLRLTIDENNTDEEIDIIIGAVRESVEYLRKFTPNQTK